MTTFTKRLFLQRALQHDGCKSIYTTTEVLTAQTTPYLLQLYKVTLKTLLYFPAWKSPNGFLVSIGDRLLHKAAGSSVAQRCPTRGGNLSAEEESPSACSVDMLPSSALASLAEGGDEHVPSCKAEF